MSEVENKINPEILEMSKIIKPELSVDKNKPSVEIKEGSDIYKKCIPNNLSIKVIKEVSSFNKTFIGASIHAMGEVALEALKKNPSMDKITGTIPMSGRDKVESTMERKRSYPSMDPNNKEKIVKKGVITSSASLNVQKSELKKLKQYFNKKAQEVL